MAKKTRNVVVLALLSLMLMFTACNNTKKQDDQQNNGQATEEVAETKTEEKTVSKNRIAMFKTSMGTFKIELFEERAPITTKNFIDLVEKGYYNGLIFHRVIANFMIQGGCPQGTGTGSPGYSIEDEFHSELTHSKAGILSMANAGPNTGGSQFFITLVPTPHLNGKHAVFGEVVEGLDIVQKIGVVQTAAGDRPVQKVTMDISIVEQ